MLQLERIQTGMAQALAGGPRFLEPGHFAGPAARVLLAMLNALQGAHYVEISEKNQNLEEFIFGWFRNRVVI